MEVILPGIEPSEGGDLPKTEIAGRGSEAECAAELQDDPILRFLRPIRSLIAEPAEDLDGHRPVTVDEFGIDHGTPSCRWSPGAYLSTGEQQTRGPQEPHRGGGDLTPTHFPDDAAIVPVS